MSNLCARCEHVRPICPELDMCARCLKKVLAQGKLPLPSPSDGLADVKTCWTCKAAGVHWSSKACRVYGLCLQCAVKEFTNLAVVPEAPEPEAPEPEGNGHASVLALDYDHLPARLNEVEQLIVTLTQRDGYEADKIGNILQLSAAMVSKLYTRALKKLERLMNP